MWSRVIAFGLGTLLLQSLAELPPLPWCVLAFLVALPLARWRPLRLLPWFIAGLLWALLYAGHLLSQYLPASLEGQDVWVQGRIASIPHQTGRRTRFVFALDQAEGWSDPGQARLSWYSDAPALKAGQRWRLLVRLKRPRGFANPGGFDYAGWLFRNGIGASGYVRKSADNRLLAESSVAGLVNRGRQDLTTAIAQRPGDGAINSLLRALAVGDRSGIERSQWEVLNTTGTNHLLAISGLHIGLVAAMGFFVGRWLWSLPGITVLHLPAPFAGALAALGTAGLYALLAGLSLPTQRAFIMVLVVMSALLARRRVAPSRGLALALAAVLLLDPLSVLQPGFWLSFGAVGLLMYGMGWRPREGGLWWRWGRAQWLIALGLFPLLAVLFHKVSVIAPLANLLAIPWVSFTVVPPLLLAVLLSGISPALAASLLDLAAWFLQNLWLLLQWMADLPHADWRFPALPGWMVASALLGVLLLLAPRGLPGRRWGVVGLLPLALYAPPRPGEGEAWFTLLDVGHGLAAVVMTRSHALLFDSGPRFSPRFDAGNAVIVPFLRDSGIKRLDTLIISHGDEDHIGGMRSVREVFPVATVYSGVPERVPGARQCLAGQAWNWDGVRFEMLHPRLGESLKGNNASCVLRVVAAGGSVLLPGDIETAAEGVLLARHAGRLASDVLVAPHHGSRSSSTEAFVDAVQPRFTLFPVGYRDRYGHPHEDVVERYREHGVGYFDSPGSGAITVTLGAEPPLAAPCLFRPGFRRYWQAPPVLPIIGRSWSECREPVP